MTDDTDKLEQDVKYAKSMARYVRWLAWIAAAMILVWCLGKYQAISAYPYPWVLWTTWGYCLIYSIWMITPWEKTKKPIRWKFGMIGFLVLSFFFVFLLIGNVMVDASIAGAAGERLGVPGFEGTILFFSLSQIPGMLFKRHPEMMV